jgi:hypothetical protein
LGSSLFEVEMNFSSTEKFEFWQTSVFRMTSIEKSNKKRSLSDSYQQQSDGQGTKNQTLFVLQVADM